MKKSCKCTKKRYNFQRVWEKSTAEITYNLQYLNDSQAIPVIVVGKLFCSVLHSQENKVLSFIEALIFNPEQPKGGVEVMHNKIILISLLKNVQRSLKKQYKTLCVMLKR